MPFVKLIYHEVNIDSVKQFLQWRETIIRLKVIIFLNKFS